MDPYKFHIFVCMGTRCAERGAEDLLDIFKGLKKSGKLGEGVLVSRSGCVKACKETETEGEYSPVVVIYPEGVWYRNVKPEDAREIVESHIKRGEIVKRLLHFVNTAD
ncbi:MAG: (2Fe-2S) ferredoxin domain-containing protein [Thermodesulfobacteriota bacterium]